MKSKSVFVVLFLFAYGLLVSQQKMIDSLENQLVNPTNGLSKSEILTKLSYSYSTIDPERGLERAKDAIKWALKEGDSIQFGIAHSYQALNYKSLGQDSLSSLFYDKAENIYREIGYNRGLSRLLLNRGIFYASRSNYRKSVEKLQDAIELFKLQKDTLLLGYSLGRLGFDHIYLGDYTASMDAFLKGASLLEKANKQGTIHYGSIQGDLGVLYQKLADYDNALKHHQIALSIFQKNKFQRLIATQYNDMGTVYNRLGQFDKALESYKASYEIKKNTKNKRDISSSLFNIGSVYGNLKQYDKAIAYIDSSKVLFSELKDYTGLSVLHENLGNIYLEKKLISKSKKQYDSAVFYGIKAEDKRAIYLGTKGLAKTSSLLGDFKTAYNYSSKASILKDSLISDEKNEELAVLKANYTYEKEKAILEADFAKNKAIDKAKIERQIFIRNMSMIVGLFILIFLSLTFILIRRKREAQIATEKANAKLQTLTSQMNPHFIFNTLNSINDYVLNNEKKTASNYLAEFSTMIRKIVKNSAYEEITLEKEIEFLQSYLRLEQKRLNNHFTFEVVVDDQIDIKNTLITPSILQTILENSIWHGLSSVKNGVLTISFSLKESFLICVVEDNGKGLKKTDTNKQQNKDSYGLDNVRDRLDLISKTKRAKAQLEISQRDKGGVRVVLQLPLSFKF